MTITVLANINGRIKSIRPTKGGIVYLPDGTVFDLRVTVETPGIVEVIIPAQDNVLLARNAVEIGENDVLITSTFYSPRKERGKAFGIIDADNTFQILFLPNEGENLGYRLRIM